MSTIKVRVRTEKRLDRLPLLRAEMNAKVAQAAYDFARGTAASARRRAPVLTGYLKSSIVNIKRGQGAHEVRVGAPYGMYVEYGTRNHPPQPFLRPAVEEQKAIFRAKFRKAFQ